jgi:O-methyltransferase
LNNTERYLCLLKKSLVNDLYIENEARIALMAHRLVTNQEIEYESFLADFLKIQESGLAENINAIKEVGGCLMLGHQVEDGSFKENTRLRNFTHVAHTMIGRRRIENIHYCLNEIAKNNIEGDLIETGVWKGGATIFMRGFLAAHDIKDRLVWVADSFEGLPKPQLGQDLEIDYSESNFPYIAISLEEVKSLFKRYDLLDEQVSFLKGWFKDTLPVAPIKKLALIRLDGDLYSSTMDALKSLYHKLSVGGFVVVDDYDGFPGCKQAVQQFRYENGLSEELIQIDSSAVYWQKC